MAGPIQPGLDRHESKTLTFGLMMVIDIHVVPNMHLWLSAKGNEKIILLSKAGCRVLTAIVVNYTRTESCYHLSLTQVCYIFGCADVISLGWRLVVHVLEIGAHVILANALSSI